jgi:hypothetical protein
MNFYDAINSIFNQTSSSFAFAIGADDAWKVRGKHVDISCRLFRNTSASII